MVSPLSSCPRTRGRHRPIPWVPSFCCRAQQTRYSSSFTLQTVHPFPGPGDPKSTWSLQLSLSYVSKALPFLFPLLSLSGMQHLGPHSQVPFLLFALLFLCLKTQTGRDPSDLLRQLCAAQEDLSSLMASRSCRVCSLITGC